MTVRKEEPKSMRHSSSWPDWAPQTVKVRVDPLSRAFTIIPTIRETLHPLLATGNTGWIDEIVLLDHGDPSSVRTKRRFANETKVTQRNTELGETFELRPLVPNVMNQNFIKTNDNHESNKGESKLPGPDKMVNDQIEEDPSKKNESNLKIFDEEQGCGSKNERTDTNQMDSKLKSVEKIQMQEDFKKDNEDPLPFETIVKIEPPKRHQNVFEEKEATGLSYQSTPKRSTTPYIEIVDYDYITASSAAENMQHACPKCTSEGLLQQRVDPFRSPVSSKKNNVARGGRCQGKPETFRKYSTTEAKMRSSWRRIGASGLIGARNKEREKYGRKRNGNPLCRPMSDARKEATLRRHYYPEGGWGYVIVTCSALVHFLGIGLQLAAPGSWHLTAELKFHQPALHSAGWLGAMSTGVALLVSPVTIAFCRRKSTRLTAVLGGLVTALGCLFTSFASQFHQLFFSYGTVVGIGVGMTRDCSTLMVAQYFKRRRELVEIFIVSGSGLGIAVMSAFIKGMISKIGWRLGLQAVTGVVFLTFILGTFYRSASLYHPQRRAILHLKNQKRKIKDKNKTDDRPPFFDFSTLKSKTVRILLISTGISAFGINTPIFYLAHQAEEEGLGDTVVLLQAYLGLAWTLGCVAFGLLVVHRSVECRIARQYLTQAAVFVCGLCILALTAVQGNYHGYVMFAWIYGIFCGGYHYSLKMYTYERVRARNFARTWGFVQCSQAIPIAIGVPISGYMNVGCGGKAGYYFSSTCVLVGGFTLFFIDLHRRNLSRHKHTRSNGTKHLCVSDSCPQRRKLSFSQEPENDGPHVAAAGAAAAALVLGTEISPTPGEMMDALQPDKPELTCISEEGIADMDLPDNMLEDLDYIGDCITSCNKVENYLMLSEFENNLIAEMPIIMDRRGRRWSIARSKGGQPAIERPATLQSANEETDSKQKWHGTNVPPNNRVITVIDEGST
ncbi:uncharacterized protein LOC117600955 isoform X1 [Osmia lignaria lignaria]|uniref:uncharacterized protein LOC117600955 isoform X1 n=1 Tax=Osmia lignaria lignaria TaxID=1437193 RepID=UPI00402BAC11